MTTFIPQASGFPNFHQFNVKSIENVEQLGIILPCAVAVVIRLPLDREVMGSIPASTNSCARPDILYLSVTTT